MIRRHDETKGKGLYDQRDRIVSELQGGGSFLVERGETSEEEQTKTLCKEEDMSK